MRGTALESTRDTREYLKARLRDLDREVFCALFLDNRHRALAFEELFAGTLNGTAVYPREVVRRALRHNAAAVIFAHNHPSGGGRTQPRRRNPDSAAQGGPGAGGSPGPGPLSWSGTGNWCRSASGGCCREIGGSESSARTLNFPRAGFSGRMTYLWPPDSGIKSRFPARPVPGGPEI